LDELLPVDAGVGEEPPPPEPELPGVNDVIVPVTSVPAGDTSHHFAPNMSLPCPVTCPEPESPT
jgi:hypothetical protein